MCTFSPEASFRVGGVGFKFIHTCTHTHLSPMFQTNFKISCFFNTNGKSLLKIFFSLAIIILYFKYLKMYVQFINIQETKYMWPPVHHTYLHLLLHLKVFIILVTL